MGPAASAFVTAELRAIGQARETLDVQGLRRIAGRARVRSSRFMDDDGARAFADDVEALADTGDAEPEDVGEPVDHRLALDAAASLLARGDGHRALVAFRDLAARHHDAASLQGLARAASTVGDVAAAAEALREAAVLLIRQNERDRAIALLEEAVRIAPLDLASHRRLAAAYANAGDVTSARCEHARSVEAFLRAGDLARARDEIEYARQTVGDAPALRELARRLESEAARPAPRLVVVPPPPAPIEPVRASAPAPPPRPAPRSGTEADLVAAAAQLMDLGKLRAASDLLLAYIASGQPGREAQRLLIAVDRKLGRMDLASEKCRLLSRVLELEGDRTGAIEVGRLAFAS
jgi:tetratricopeptide (TPR) repeat protein